MGLAQFSRIFTGGASGGHAARVDKARARPFSGLIDGLFRAKEPTGNAVRDLVPTPQLPPQL
jgi:hypothetical protein